MPLTRDQFDSLTNQGFSVDEIVSFEKRRQTESQPIQRSDRFTLKSSQPYDSYSYGDAFKDTGKTVINSLANLGENTINTVANIPQIPGQIGNAILHPIQTGSNVVQGIGNKINEYNSMDKLANKVSTDPIGFGSDAVTAGMLAQGGTSLAKGIVQGGKNIGEAFNFDKKGLDLAQKARIVASQTHQAKIDSFGLSQEVIQKANPNSSISLADTVDSIKQNMVDMAPEAKAVFRKVPILKDMLKEPGAEGYIDPNNITLQDSQKIINYMNTKIPNTIKSNHLDILDAQNDIRAAQLDAFPDMQKVREIYGQHAKDYKLVKSSLRPGATVNAIKSNFANNTEIKDAATRIFTPDILKGMKNYRNKINAINVLKGIGIPLSIGEGVRKVLTGRF